MDFMDFIDFINFMDFKEFSHADSYINSTGEIPPSAD
jgi:hypothetical protein